MKEKKIMISLLLSILFLVVSTAAWFIFNKSVNVTMEAKVKSWDLEFTYGGEEITESVRFEIESIYPGMPDEIKTIDIKNNGETVAELTYRVKSITLLGETKVVGVDCTQEEMDEYIESLPFDITLEQEKDILEGNGEETNVKIIFSWEYEDENGDSVITEKDKKDTELGKKAYEYSQIEGHDEYNLKIDFELVAKQKNN